MPPVFGPTSPSQSRLWSRAGGSARASRPSQSAIRLASRPVEPLLDHDPGPVRSAEPRRSIAASASSSVVADGHALAGREAVGLDDDRAVPGVRARARTPGPSIGSPALDARDRAIGTPAAAAISWQNALLVSIRAAAAVGPKTAMPGRVERVGHAGRQRRLRPDDDELDAPRGAPRRPPAAASSGSTPATRRTRGSAAIASLPGRDDRPR